MTNIIKSLADAMARPVLLFYALPWLMLLLVLGTVAQRYIGLYQSQKLFFGSFLLWIGIIPLPGAYATIGLIALALCCKLILKSPFRKHNAGTIIAHASVLLLLVGGLVTAATREEGYMLLAPAQSSRTVSDYHDRELAVLKNGQWLLGVPRKDIHAGKAISDARMPFSLTVSKYCDNCKIIPLEHPFAALRDLAAKFDIVSAPPELEDAKNQSGTLINVQGDPDVQGTYLADQALNQQPELRIGNDTYRILIRQSERLLPFTLRLIKFEKADYPGTDLARSYRSEVELTDGALSWRKMIEMNDPLRYRGYTFYQSSFVENDGTYSSVLAVVTNSGDVFPYIAITALCIGLIIHLVVRVMRRKPV